MKDIENRYDTSKDRTYINTKIWLTNIVKTARLVLQMLFVAYIIG